ncbi:MAG: hypothetical protein IJ033_05710 [Clostridia bacterium]|nr:hypothetical protein [Clostridia bacterium]
MTERFKKYLEQEFRAIPPTKGAMDYRKATLVRLEEYAQDARIKGMTDEDAIYNLAIDSLGDFRSTLIAFNAELTDRPKRNNRRLFTAIATAVTVLIVLGLYLVTSLLHLVPWSTSWLILVGPLFAAIISLLTLNGISIAKRKSYVVPRVFLVISIVLASTFVFLVLLMLTRLPYAWFTFLAMVIVIFLSDTLIGFLTKSKLAFLESQATLIITSALLYVMLGIAHVMPWHPGWLLPALAAIAAVAALIVMLIHRSNKKKAPKVKKSELKPTTVDEKFYTEW